MTTGLKEETIKQIRNVLNSFPEVEEVILYGSRAKGNYKPASDIDLTLKGQHLDLTILNRINTRLDDLLLPCSFDLSIYHHIKQSDLLDHINRVGMVFYKKNLIEDHQ